MKHELPEVRTAPPWTPSPPRRAARCPEHGGDAPGQGDLSDLSSSASRVTTWRQPRPRGRSQQAGPGGSWRRHGNRAQRHPGPGLFTLPLWPASSATLKPIHPGEPGPRPCPPPARPSVRSGRLFLPHPFLPLLFLPATPPSAAFAKALEGESWANGGLRFSILSRFPLHRQRALSCIFFPYYHKRRNLH